MALRDVILNDFKEQVLSKQRFGEGAESYLCKG